MHTRRQHVKPTDEAGNQQGRFSRFYHLNLLANVLGIFTMGALNFFTPMDFKTVNVAARIQDLTKQFKWDILISEETAALLKRTVQLRRETPVMVKGYSRPVTVYRLLG